MTPETRSQLRSAHYWCTQASTPPTAGESIAVSGGDMSSPTEDAALDHSCARARAVVTMAARLLADPDAGDHLARKVIEAADRVLNSEGEVTHGDPPRDLTPWTEALKTQTRLYEAGLRETEPRVYLTRRLTQQERNDLIAENDEHHRRCAA